jgi:transposase
VRPNAAGIDIGSRKHYVAVPVDRTEQPVRHFGCFTPDLHEMARWLRECGIDTVAMEATGVYWIPAFQVLEQYGFDVQLVDAYQVKNVPGRKTDVSDCQWLQDLHTFGLLSSCFIPDNRMSVLRSYWRQRTGLIECCAKQIHLMQKSLDLMNLHLHKVISDITGVTGMRIVRAIVSGERNAVLLASMKHPQVKSTEDEIAKALSGNYREEHLFALTQALELYDVYQQKIADCDEQIDRYMGTFEDKKDHTSPKTTPPQQSKAKRRKNQPHFKLDQHLYRITGVDLTRIDGIDSMTAQTIITECGFDMSRFPTEKNFTSWLRLCPDNRITGGKRKRPRKKWRAPNRAAQALHVAAQSLHSSKSALGAFYRKMRARLGAPKAITATAHKLAKILYRLLKHGEDYVDRGQKAYEQKYHERLLKNLTKRAKEMGYQLVQTQTGELVS